LSFARYRDLGGVFVVRRHEVDYLGAALEGDALVVRTWITRTTRVSSIRAYEVLRDTERLVRATTTWAFVSLDSGRPCRIPAAVRAAFEIEPE
jgi:acyl-CoA thioester hydrolase